MRLLVVRLHRFMQYVDQRLDVDPFVTVLVGQNDTGKTNLLRWFFDQHVKERAIHGRARSLVKGYETDPISFDLVWEIEAGDDKRYPLVEAFGRADVGRIELSFTHESPDRRDYRVQVDGSPLDAYEPRPNERGESVLKEVFRSRDLFPEPYYLALGDKDLMPFMFEARFYELPPGATEPMFIRDFIPTEELFLRVAGLRAQMRHSQGRGVEEPWSPPLLRSSLSLKEIENAIASASERVTRLLSRWWQDPRGLQFEAKIGGPQEAKESQHRLNSYAITWEIKDRDGTNYYGAGLRWFVSLLIELLWIDQSGRQYLLLIDEPAYNLHPRAQRVAARLLSDLAARHQVIYSTHSPFMIDWSFPQRIRLLERDPVTKISHVRNKPYHPTESLQNIWDPLREAIGVSMGDLAVIGERNIFVEGVSDQILLANALATLARDPAFGVDPSDYTILPFGSIDTLKRLILRVKSYDTKVVAVCDSDEGGREASSLCKKLGLKALEIGELIGAMTDSSIEDIIGVEKYVEAVNDVYSSFEWFAPLKLDEEEHQGRSLGKWISDVFAGKFPGRTFDKTGIAVALAAAMQAGDKDLAVRFEPTLQRLTSSLLP